MSHSPRIAFWRWPTLLLVIALSAMALRAQQVSESFEGFMSGIRANVVKGPVTYQQGEGKFNVEPGLKLEEGDFVRTGVDGLAELLLQPGNYLRVAGDTECQIFSDEHDKMRLKLNRGAISIEILARGSSPTSSTVAPSSLATCAAPWTRFAPRAGRSRAWLHGSRRT